MTSAALERYARGEHEEVIIDVTTSRIEDLYHDFDKQAPHIRRDLDPQLTDYLYECAQEISGHPFAVRFTFERPLSEADEERLRTSVPKYFTYMASLQQQAIGDMFRRALVFLGVGLILVALSVWVNVTVAAPRPGEARSITKEILGEGLTIASWVAMWQALATLLVGWIPRRRDRRVFLRLAVAPLSVSRGVPEHLS